MTTTDTAAHDVEERLETRARTMNGADSPFAGEDHTYTRGYYGPLDRDLDREAASLIRQLRDENGALKHDIERYVAISSEEATRAESAVSEASSLRSRVEALEKALSPFALVAELDIGDTETDEDIFRPMDGRNALAGVLRVGHFRTARAVKGGGDAAE